MVPPVFAFPPVFFVPLGLELPPVALRPPFADIAPPLLELSRAVMPPEAAAPPLAGALPVVPPATESTPVPELAWLHATDSKQRDRCHPNWGILMNHLYHVPNPRALMRVSAKPLRRPAFVQMG